MDFIIRKGIRIEVTYTKLSLAVDNVWRGINTFSHNYSKDRGKIFVEN